MRLSSLFCPLSLGLVASVAASALESAGSSLISRQLPGADPTAGATPEEAQCISDCSRGIVESHQSEYEKCTSPTLTLEAQQSCICKSDFLKQEQKCITKCFSKEVAKQAEDATKAVCNNLASDGGSTPDSGLSGEDGANSLRVPAGAAAIIAVMFAAGL
ncbi:hypothetical protein AURDEDRAFT_116963 [Auricularia subglabra TFB-10046 SS5]|uniref:Extracellular membrane protein CFEM domain-containing protein n=1 Tax=Auricularia subglabra (strain TFB-10046 / SS5) TaxID=717982 RepID=J0LH04_AURST|nr:hypothetical protein AURDEDRAFT_116963 [Auricularia subglabra TFB-10046 SS5]